MSKLLEIPRISSNERLNLLAGQRVLLLTLTAAICVNVCIGVRLAANPTPMAPLLPENNQAGPVPADQAAARQAVAAAQIVLASTEEFDRLAEDWKHRAEALLTSQAGRRIAADKTRVAAFIARYERLQRDQAVANQITDSINELLGQFSDQQVPVPTASRSLMLRLYKVQSYAEALVPSWRAAHEELDRWTSDREPLAQFDLRSAVAKLHTAAAQQPGTAADRVRDELRETQGQMHARLQQLKDESQHPQVLDVLRPFVTPGHRRDGQVRADRRPYSLAYLQRIGALDPTPAGYASLVRAAVQSDQRSQRWHSLLTAGGVQPQRWDNHQVRLVRDAQAYLRKYGEALVSTGRLEP